MRVKAIAVGFHGSLRVPGTPDAEFDIRDDEKLGSWMRPVDPQETEPRRKPGRPKAELPDA